MTVNTCGCEKNVFACRAHAHPLSKVEAWLPIFSGFYGTIWETDSDEEMEFERINEERAAKELPPITWDAIEWDYDGYTRAVTKGVTSAVFAELKTMGLVSGCEFQKLSSPREYNFANDSIHVIFTLNESNKRNIATYLKGNITAFAKYLERYKSGPGFMSFYSYDVLEWLDSVEENLAHEHKLGAVLDFILRNEDEDMEMRFYDRLHSNGVCLQASNYATITGEK